MKFTDSVESLDGVKIVYEVSGNGEPALVFAHCWCGSRSYLKEQVEHFSKKHICISLDLAGHGESGINRERWTIEAFAQDVVAVVKKINPGKVILIGHSIGAVVMLDAALKLKNKVIGLVGIDSFANIEFKLSEEELTEFVKPYERNFAETTREYISALFPRDSDKQLVTKISDELASANPLMAVDSFKEYLRYDSSKAFQQQNIPVILINSDKHPTNIDALKRHIKKVDLEIMKNTGHFFIMEQPDILNKLLEEMLDKNIPELNPTSQVHWKIKKLFGALFKRN
jgi:pimeloyl-ACP methyl ester carboxylesterase